MNIVSISIGILAIAVCIFSSGVYCWNQKCADEFGRISHAQNIQHQKPEVAMFFSCRNAAILLPLLVSSLFAGPEIEFDSKTFNCGTAIEGKTEKINATFRVKNTGDAVLKLESVRPGCGCTVVKYDTLIQPGKTSKIESEVNIKGNHRGPLSKSITVTSNAIKNPVVRLTIEATIKAVIDISDDYIALDTAKSVYLTSNKKDLKVTDVIFKMNGNSGTPEWQANVPFSLKYSWKPLDSVVGGGRVFKLDIIATKIGKTVYGEFVIKTNHPDNPELSITGTINR